MPDQPLTAEQAFRRYEAIRSRLPSARFPASSLVLPTLSEAADRWDGFVLDAFGVLNVGDRPISGAVERLKELRARGKRLCILTNASSTPAAEALAKYHRLGFDVSAREVVSSRAVAAARLEAAAPGATWAAIAAEGDSFADLPVRMVDAMETPGALDGTDALLFLSTQRWSDCWQDRLVRALERRPRPVVVANPDLVAPRENGLSREPGFYAHDIIDRLGLPVRFFGKPFSEAFADAATAMDLQPNRLAMVGDTPHTDILGGAAAGFGTILVAQHGLFAGQDVSPFLRRCGIVPNVVATTT